jgi:N-acetylglucosamine kinase-like BadF-type ATPase
VRCVLGVDAGNTKTIALVARPDGTILGAGRGGCGDIYPAGEAALGAVDDAVAAALGAAGARPADLLVGAFSMAGADWPEDFALLRDAVGRRGLGRTTVVVNDAMGALRAGSPDGTGVVIACGTGIATGARAPDGRTWHSSFWQEANGAHELGAKTLRAVYRAELGIDPPTALTARVLAHFGQDRVEDVLHLFTARGVRRPTERVGGLARVLLDEADRGDAVARRAVRHQGVLLGDYAAAAARRVGIEGTPFTLALAGGVFRHPGRELADAVLTRVRATSPDIRPVRSRFEPAVGAVLLALEAAGVTADEALRDRLAATAPPPPLFET